MCSCRPGQCKCYKARSNRPVYGYVVVFSKSKSNTRNSLFFPKKRFADIFISGLKKRFPKTLIELVKYQY